MRVNVPPYRREFGMVRQSTFERRNGHFRSPLGRRIAGDREITSIDEFRERVPFTTYADYEELLGQQREDALEHRPLTDAYLSKKTPDAPKILRSLHKKGLIAVEDTAAELDTMLAETSGWSRRNAR